MQGATWAAPQRRAAAHSRPAATTSDASPPARRRSRPHRLAWLLSLPFLAFLVIPLAALVLRLPPSQLIPSLQSPQVVQAVTLSMITTLVTTVVTICFGTPVGYLLARHRFRLHRVVDTLVDLPTVLRWTFFPNPSHVVNSNIPDVTLGWANAFWQIMQFLIIFLAFTHSANGLRMIAEDYVGHTLWQPFVRAFFALLWLAMIIIAVYVVIGSAY